MKVWIENFRTPFLGLLTLVSAAGIFGVEPGAPLGAVLECETDAARPACESLETLPLFALCGALIFCYATYTSWRARRVVISSIDMTMSVFLSDNSLGQTVMTVIREQRIRALRPGVSAYYSTSQPTRGGFIPKDSMALKVRWGDIQSTGRPKHESKQRFAISGDSGEDLSIKPPRAVGSATKGWEVMHEFGGSLPYYWYSSLIPSYLMREDNKETGRFRSAIARKHSAVRKGIIQYVNDFSDGYGEFYVFSSTYEQERIEVRIYFEPEEIEAVVIDQRAVLPQEIRPESGRWGRYKYVKLDRLRGRLLVTFSKERSSSEPIPNDWDRLLPEDPKADPETPETA